jgi:outer membrane autotransporter protein
MTRRNHRRECPLADSSLRVFAMTIAVVGTLLAGTGAARAADFIVNSQSELIAAINGANASTDAINTITLGSNIALSQALPILNPQSGSQLVIEGGGNTIDGQNQQRIFFANTGDIAIRDVTLANAKAQGGNGGNNFGGGGGMGAGGAVFVRGDLDGHAGASVTLRNVAVVDNAAEGGDGGILWIPGGPTVHPGGGGGLGGDGGSGADGSGSGGQGGGGAFPGQNGNVTTTATGAQGGGPDGGAGGSSGQNGGPGGEFSGGGGGGTGGNGGGGGFGGGGGGGGGGVGSTGGAGGFGGGGGGNGSFAAYGNGGAGGYGGGGGIGTTVGGQGGFGGADGNPSGSTNNAGGGGAGMGGGLFVMEGGTLIIEDGFTVNGNTVTGGRGRFPGFPPRPPNDGEAFGSGMFLQGSGNATFRPSGGQTQTIDDVIADEAGVVANGYTPPAGFTPGQWSLTKDGDGTLVLSGDNAFAGGTVLGGGALSVGHDNALGSGTLTALGSAGIPVLDIQNGIAIANATDLQSDLGINVGSGALGTHAGDIGGTGSLHKIGGGTLTLSGNNTYSGGTGVDAGTLQAGAENMFGSGAMNVASGAVLDLNDFNQTFGTLSGGGDVLLGAATLTTGDATDGTFSGAISGDGGLTKESGGAFRLTGTSTYTGPTTVNAGKLIVDGTIASEVTVNDGGMLMGSGMIGGDAMIMSGGMYAPGNSIGTQTIAGNLMFASGAVLQVEVNAAGASDKIIVNGTVNLTGAALQVLAANGAYRPKTNYTIIENDGSDAVTGTFASITSNLAFLTPAVFYNAGDGNDVVLRLERTSEFCSVAKTKNECNVATALDQFATNNDLFLAVLNQTAAGARQAFDALSGEIYATVSGVLADDSRYVRDAVLGRLMQAGHTGRGDGSAALAAAGPQSASIDANAMTLGSGSKSLGEDMPASAPAPLAFWTRAFGAWGDFNGDGNAATADRDLGGFVSGMDANIGGSWRAGLATGSSFSNVAVDARHSSANVESYYLGGYLGGMAGAFAMRGGGMWAWNDIDTSRAVIFPGFYERQKASYDADTGQLFGEVAYPTQMYGMALEPFGGLAYVSIDGDNFQESGGPLASLRGSADQDVGYSTVGVRAATTLYWGAMQVVPHISAAWQHAFNGVTPDAALAFASNGVGFTVYGVPLAEDTALIDAGLDFGIGDRTTAGLSYTGQYGDGVSDNGVKGRFTWLF